MAFDFGASFFPHQEQMSDQHNNNSLVHRNYIYNVTLKPLNGTFQTKHLLIPFQPFGLKLGRPISSNTAVNNTAANRSKNPHSSPTDNIVSPTNGNFDSRVLSRNHALINCDPNTGKLYIKDLNSSNGTFVNGKKISKKDNLIEICLNDVIDLGTDIDTKLTHKKISARVENIIVIPLQSFQNHCSVVSTAAFESSIFGDINHLDLEDTILNMDNEIISGIFINNTIGTSDILSNVLKKLSMELSLMKYDLIKMKSVDDFLIEYNLYLDKNKNDLIERNNLDLKNFKHLLNRRLVDEKNKNVLEFNKTFKQLTSDKLQLNKILDDHMIKEENSVQNLDREIEDLKTRLEVEKYKFNQLEIRSKRDIQENVKQKNEWRKIFFTFAIVLLTIFVILRRFLSRT